MVFDEPCNAEQLQKVLLTVFGGNTIHMVLQGLFQWRSLMSLVVEMKGLKSCISKCSVLDAFICYVLNCLRLVGYSMHSPTY